MFTGSERGARSVSQDEVNPGKPWVAAQKSTTAGEPLEVASNPRTGGDGIYLSVFGYSPCTLQCVAIEARGKGV